MRPTHKEPCAIRHSPTIRGSAIPVLNGHNGTNQTPFQDRHYYFCACAGCNLAQGSFLLR
jgi:hypothetical protein